ncbi:hypothetical protein SAMN05421664_1747 [Chryseobacterium soldanellicola]|uniref:Uncharacterized protein n=1 Tax=Chryseobacterium soldanellicola TaxID=311333 RepID=A0A1H1B791_9FLAO|nr:hypothetical protein [Chryseobacterium soldanellicola]SDQ47762.1 hypothetical protein SAMN05421664_1747 [Chryseobacterium soldanellicola]
MKKVFLLFFIPYCIFAQIGINNPNPASTLDITAKNPTGTATQPDGMIIPRLDRQRAQNMTSTPTSTLIYINNPTTGTQAGTAVNIDAAGFYFYDGTVWTKIATGENTNIYTANGTLSGARNVGLGGNNLGFTGTGNVGIGIASPTAKLEIASGTSGTSGLKFSNINNTTATTQNAATIGVDAGGNVVIQNTVPLSTTFKSFNLDANTPTNSLLTIGNLQFRATATSCPSGSTSFVQVRSTTGASNIGIVHGQYTTAQNASSFVNTAALTAATTFTDITTLPLNCFQDGHLQLSFFSYTDRTYYRVSVNLADGDGLGFGALGYIFAELQR